MIARIYRAAGRAPARIVASVAAIALAVGAIGVFAVPDVAAGSLRDIAAADRIAHLSADTTVLSEPELQRLDLSGLPAVEVVESQLLRTVEIEGAGFVRLLGIDIGASDVDVVSPEEGRLPTGPGEVLVSDGVAEIGDRLGRGPDAVEVVGIGGTAWWAEEDVVFTTLETATAMTGIDGVNRLVLRLDDPTEENLAAAVTGLRQALADEGAAITAFPTTVPGGRHPIEEDLTMISTMIGLLGVVAAFVAFILLASTTNTSITERTREVAVMRALGGRRRWLRLRLRAMAIGIAVAGGAVGVVLGTVVANLIARMVLTRFAGLTPGIGFSVPVSAASLAIAVGGAWLVAGRAVRRVTRLPLGDALRDRSGSPYGRRFSERLAARIRVGGLFERVALRTAAHSRGRTVAVAAQMTGGIAAIIVVSSLAASVSAFDEAELEPWQFATRTTTVDPGTALPADLGASYETGIVTIGAVGEWEIDVLGLRPDAAVIDPTVREGRWIEADRPGVVLTDGFARNQGIEVGDTITVELAQRTVEYEVVGTHRWRALAVFVPVETLAADLGAPGFVNSAYGLDPGTDPSGLDLAVATTTTTLALMSEESVASRAAIIDIFTAIGLVVAVVSLLRVSSAMAVNVHERRHELAAVAAIGGRRRQVRRLLATELVPLALFGSVAGSGAGWFGAKWIVGAFEDAEAIEIGTVFASGMVPVATAGALGAVALIAGLSARRITRRPPASVLRGAA